MNNSFKFYFQNQNFANYFYSLNRKAFQNQDQISFDQNQFSNANQQQKNIINVSQQFCIIGIVTFISFNSQKKSALQIFQNRFSNTRNQSAKFGFQYINTHLPNNQQQQKVYHNSNDEQQKVGNEHNNTFQKITENLNQNQKLHQKYLQKYHENDVINKIYEFYKISFEIFQKSHFTHFHDVNNIKK